MFVIPAVFILIILTCVIGMVAWFISNKIFGVSLAGAFTNTRMFFQRIGAKAGPAFALYFKIIMAVFFALLLASIIAIFVQLSHRFT
jgi:hypothetical protein